MAIRFRMWLLGVSVIALALLVFSALIYALIARAIDRDQERVLRRRAQETGDFLQGASAEQFRPQRVPAALDLRRSEDVFILVVDAAAGPLSSTGEVDGAAPSLPREVLDAAPSDEIALTTVEPSPGVRLRLAVQPWERPDLGRRGVAVAGQSLRHNESQRDAILGFMAASAVLSLLVAGVAIWVVLGRAVRPLTRVAGAADEIARTRDLSRRLPPVRTRDEVGRLTGSFNGMLARLQEMNDRLSETLESQTRFVADASHELRTPLTSIRTNAAFLQQPDAPPEEREAALRDIAAEGERMSRLVQDLLTLARADAGQRLETAPVDLAAVAREVCRRARLLYPERRIDVAGDDPLPFAGNADALDRMLWILVENAARHTPQGGGIRIRPLARPDLGAVQVKVVDDGQGIPEADLERVFDRFYQVDPARSDGGAGLGLAIARWIAAAHGGTLTAANNDAGGATFTFQAPAVPEFCDADPRAGRPSGG